MLSRMVLVAGLIAVVFALSGAPAWAQSAGDEQYNDPFAGQQDQGSSAQPAPTATAAPAPAPAPAPAAAQAAPAAPAPTASAAQLPRTGAETLLTALAGVGLVMAGVGLRLRLPADGG
jgi:LPXTG-motif cell wall-anchored protein